MRVRAAFVAVLCGLFAACGEDGADSAGGGGGGAGGATASGGSAVTQGGNGGGSGGANAKGGASVGTGGAGTGGAAAAVGGTGEGGAAAAQGGAGEGGAAAAGGGSGSASGGASGGSGGTGGAVGDGIVIDGRGVFVDGRPLHLRGVCWNPVPRGAGHPAGLDYAGLAATDIPLMQAAGINAVRTYEPLTDVGVLDQLAAAGIYVLNSVYPYGGDAASVVTARVNAVREHPAILMWVLGNEWNYNGLYVDLSHADALARLNEAAALVKAADTTHPVATIYGELPSADTLAAMPDIDVWGINAYRGISFGDLFTAWAARGEKPMFLSEYGADAYNADIDAYDPESQAEAVRALGEELGENSVALASGVTLGGTVFEWADEWWKDDSGSPNEHDVGGIAPGGGPYPDQVFNEEWWGVVDVDRAPRPAYEALREVFASQMGAP